MKKLVLMLGVFLSSVSPFSLNAFNSEEYDYSVVLGSESFVNHTYDVMDRLFDLFIDFDEELREIIELYPEASASIELEKDLDNLSQFFAEQEKNRRLIPFVFFGIYKGADYQDRENLSELKLLQSNIFKISMVEHYCIEKSREGSIDTDKFASTVTSLEGILVPYMLRFCALSEDDFFNQDVVEFIGENSTRLEALLEALGVDFEEVDEEELSDVEQAFIALAEDYLPSLSRIVEEFLSNHILEELSEKLWSEVGSSLPDFGGNDCKSGGNI